jgi:predicted GH43/DUF377 family glycosyl hydrolase
MPAMRLLIPSLLIASGCVRVSELPYLGECAEYPDGHYEFGQIGIGACISGPNALQFVGDPANPTLLVTNANPYQIFDGGSLLAIPWNALDFGDGSNEIHTLDPTALALTSMAIGIEVNDDLGFIGLRDSPSARTRVHDDAVYLVDLTDPAAPAPSTRGTNGEETVAVLSDPVDVVIDDEAGLAFVANRTDHNISVLDTTEDTIKVIKPWPHTTVTAAVYADNSGTGGQARMTSVDILGEGLLIDDVWTLTWVEGTWRLWIPTEGGLTRATTQLHRDEDGTIISNDSAMGLTFSLDDTNTDVIEITDPNFSALTGRMLYASEGEIWGASTGDYIGDWNHDQRPTLSADTRDWMGWLGGPSVAPGPERIHIFFDAQEAGLVTDGRSVIGSGTTDDGLLFNTRADPILEPTHPHEGEHIADPHVVYDSETLVWRMMYSAFDGDTWSIGHATSEDLITWVSDEDPLFVSALGAAAPVVHHSSGRWHMWFSEWDGSAWSVAAAESRDGSRWTRTDTDQDFGTGVIVDDLSTPPSIAMQGSATDAFQVRGEHSGSLAAPLIPGYAFAAVSVGWSVEVIAGSWLDVGQAGTASNGGIRIGSTLTQDDGSTMSWTTLTNRASKQSIGSAIGTTDGQFSSIDGPVFTGGSKTFEDDGVSHPVVFRDGDTLKMLYAGLHNGNFKVGLATSVDGLSWTSQGKVFSPGTEDWDRISVIPNSIVTTPSGNFRMWYSGFDGSRWRIGSATSADGLSWARDDAPRGYQFGLGEPGAWDDSGVKDAWVITGVDGDHLWYSGFDGDNWRIGYAFREANEAAFSRSMFFDSGDGRPVLDYEGGPFHRSDVTRPVVTETETGFSMTYGGWTNDTVRVGRAFGFAPDRFNRTPNTPRVGDTLTFSTERGDEDIEAIPLDGYSDGHQTTGIGLTALHLDPERGFLYAVSKLYAGIFVIDVRDDTDATAGFFDKNYLDVEAVIMLNTTSWATGFRQIITIPESDTLYALVDSPASVVAIDLSDIVDDEYPDYVTDPATGYLAAPRGLERDLGADSMSSVGPGQMLLHPDGRRLFVSNFNRNSITTFDLSMGPYGMPISDTPNVGENPYAMTFTPDGRQMVFGNYTGVLDKNVSHASLGVLDIDEDSSNYLEVLTWIVNL